jgi:hypothetical protein
MNEQRMNEQENKELALQEEKALSSFLEQGAGTGFENVDSNDLQPNFLRICQAGHHFTEEANPSYKPGFKLGDFFDTSSNINMSNTVEIVVLGYFTNYCEWGPDDLGDFKGSHSVEDFNRAKKSLTQDKKNPSTYWNQEGNKLVETKNFFVYIPAYPELGILLFNLKSTGIGHSKKWLTNMSYVKHNGATAPMYASLWRLKTMYVSNDQNSWYAIGDKKNLNVERVGFVPSEHQKAVLEYRQTVSEWINSGTKIKYSEDVEESFDGSDLEESI